MTRMDMSIRKAIRELMDDYERSPTSYLTESDIVASLACRLRKRLGGRSVHIGLCPVRKEKEMIVGESKEFELASRGCAVDIAVLEEKSVLSTVNRDTEKKYWRYLRFPVENFKAAIEVKVRVSGNRGRIRDDMKKLETIRDTDSHPLIYLVILDKKAKRGQMKNVLRDAREKNIEVIFHANYRVS